MKVVNCPDEAGRFLHDHRLRVFLAGGITNCPDWQKIAIWYLDAEDNDDLLLMNPRRSDFDVNDVSMEKKQIEWEYRHINYADLMLFWFPEETLCPITLFELGKCVGMRKDIVVGCHPGYKRRRDVIEQLSLMELGVVVRDSLYDVISDLNRYRK